MNKGIGKGILQLTLKELVLGEPDLIRRSLGKPKPPLRPPALTGALMGASRQSRQHQTWVSALVMPQDHKIEPRVGLRVSAPPPTL